MPRDSLKKQGKVAGRSDARTKPRKRRRDAAELSSSSSSSSEDDNYLQAPKRKGKTTKSYSRQEDDDNEISGDYTPKYKDDKTGTRPLHPTALRFTLGIAEDLARQTATIVAKSLEDDGEVEESRKVLVRSQHHAKTVITRVREKLRDEKLPTHYVRIEDLNLNELAGTNQNRREDIATNEKLIKKLEQQVEALKKENQAAKTQRDEAQSRLDAKQQQERSDGNAIPIHPLLQSITGPDSSGVDGTSAVIDTGEGNGVSNELFKKRTLAELFGTIPSPYD